MIHFKTIKNIRKKHNLSQEEFADMLGYPVDYICSLEDSSGERSIASREFVAKLKDTLNLHDIPLTDEDKAIFYNRLNTLKYLIDYGYTDQAVKLIPDIARCAEASCHSSFINLCDLFTAYCSLETSDFDAFEQKMSFLDRKRQSFDSRHHHYFNLLTGQWMYYAGNYNAALASYVKAEDFDKNSQLKGVNFYFFYGLILSDIGYAVRAVKYLKNAAHHARWNKVFNGKPNSRYDVYIDGYLADNLSKIGQSEEALTILNKRLDRETKLNSEDDTIGYIYLAFGTVFLRAEQYHKALENFEIALRYLDERSEAYKTNLYRKALALIASGMISEGIGCMDEGLSMPIDDLWKTLFEAVKHSASLSDPVSLEYMETTVISKLLKHGQYEDVLRSYKILSDFFGKNGDYERALKYCKLAVEVHEKLFKERIEVGA